MERLKSPGELSDLRISLQEQRRADRIRVRICTTGCRAYGAMQICQAFEEEIESRGLDERIEIVRTGCHGFCARAPVIAVDPQGLFYQQLTPADVPEIVAATLAGKVVERLTFPDPVGGRRLSRVEEVPFFKGQTKVVLRNCGQIDPTEIAQYIERDGYAALARVLAEMTPDEVIEEVKASGLRGRGGAGFPTGVKWELARKVDGEVKYVVCNGDEGDPGAFMDRGVLEGDPHSVLEGMAIAGYAIGAQQGYIYVREEYPIAVQHLRIAIAQAEEFGLLGEDILSLGLNFTVEIREGAGAFVCGEETALIASIEGKRGTPRPRPPFPAQSGLWGCPTNINNVETYANIAPIVLRGGEQYARVGTERSKGTKIFSLAGKINNTGLVEVPMGIALEEIVHDIGGGIPGGKKFKAVQLGGPSGGCVPARHLDLPVDYDSLKEVGAIMGSGGMIVMDERTCMVEIARFFTDFVQSESCGKCVPCRIGTRRMLEILTRITRGEGCEGDIELLEELGKGIKDSSLCGLGQTAPNPVLSTIRFFRDEYESHIKHKHCPAATCEALVVSPCQHTCPIHENAHTYIGLIAEGRFAEAYRATRERNPFPAICGRVCFHPCESRCRRGDLDEPIAICALKRFVADYAAREGIDMPDPAPRRWHEKIAVIGGGPAGLSVAYHLVKRGYPVTVFEAMPEAGGMLAVGIPEYRLPRDVLRREVAALERLGVEIRCNTRVGADVDYEELRREYDAVFISVGAHGGRRLGVPGEDLEGVFEGVSLLRAINLGEHMEIGQKVVVVGGGNVAMDAARSAARLGAQDATDAARSAARLGAEEVTVVYRRSREEMPAHEVELVAAEEEGVDFLYLTAPARILGNGRVSGVECVRMRLGKRDADGRRRPEPVEGSETIIEADTVIVAIGQEFDLSFLPGDQGLEMTPWGTVAIDPESCMTSCEGVFAGGDVVGGEAMVVAAIADGEKTAMNIHRYLRKGAVEEGEFGGPLRLDGRPEERLLAEEVEGEQPRVAMSQLQVTERLGGFQEVELGYTEEQAMAEARRCLQCQYHR